MGVLYLGGVGRQNSPAYCLRADLEYDFALVAAPAELGPCLVGVHGRVFVVQTRARESNRDFQPGRASNVVDWSTIWGERVRGEEG